VDNFSPRP